MEKLYLGDGVYAAFDGWSIILTTENGVAVTNTIVLEPDVYEAPTRYAQRVWQPSKETQDGA